MSVRKLSSLPRNVWAVSLTSFFMDISSEMVMNLLPLFLTNVLGVGTAVVGLVEGVAESIASVLKLPFGWLSDRMGKRKWLAVAGYALSAAAKPFFYFAGVWATVAGARWADRVGKGIRTAPRDALVADSVGESQRGLAFGFHRAADTGGAAVGIGIAILLVWLLQSWDGVLTRRTFEVVVLVSIVPAALAVLSLMFLAKDKPSEGKEERARPSFRALGRPFMMFLVIVGVFELGNSSEAFLVLRAQDCGLSILGILGMLFTFNLVYSMISTPGGRLSDRIGRKPLIVGGWLFYAAIYLGFAFAKSGAHAWVLYAFYGVYYGLAYGTAKALVADIVPKELRGTAYGAYSTVVGILDLPASLIAGILWQGMGSWSGLGAPAPFMFGAATAFLAAILMLLWKPRG